MDEDTDKDNKTKRQPTGDYGVGYCRPPESTRFKKGQSGNRRGRPKGSKNIATYLDEILRQRIRVREGGKERTMSKAEAVFHKVMHKAMMGDLKALSSIMALARSSGLLEPVGKEQAGPTGVLLVPTWPDRSPEGLLRLEEEVRRNQDGLQAKIKSMSTTEAWSAPVESGRRPGQIE